MFNRIPKILGVTWPKPRPFWVKLFQRPLGFSKRKLRTKFEVSSSSSFEDRFNCIPKILGVTWPRPRPFGESARSAFPRLCTKFEVASLSSFEDSFNCMRDLGHAPFGENYLSARSAFPRWSCIPKLKSSSSSFEDTFDRIPEILGVTWPRPRPLWGKFCIFLFRFAKIYSSVTNLKCLRSLSFVLRPL